MKRSSQRKTEIKQKISKTSQIKYKIFKLKKPGPKIPLIPVQQDFPLQTEGKISDFLQTKTDFQTFQPITAPDQSKFSFIGSWAHSSQTQTQSIHSIEQIQTPIQIPFVPPQIQFKEKLIKIKKGKILQQEKQRITTRRMSTGARLVHTYQKRALECFRNTQSNWSKIQKGLSRISNRSPLDSTINRCQEYREKLEKLTRFRTKTPQNYLWQMTLRSDKPSDIYIPVGNSLSGLFTKFQQRPKHRVVIRRPHSRYSSKYEKFHMKSEVDDLEVVGEGKLSLELDSVRRFGVSTLNLDLIDPPENPEVFEENYDFHLRLK